MLTSVKAKLQDWKYKAKSYAGSGVLSVEAIIAKDLLLWNPDFRLICVQQADDGNGWSLAVVTPSLDEHVRRQVAKQGYYTLSHLWGHKGCWTPWTEHGVLGTDGRIVRVEMRPEKQDTILRLLQEHPGFWWIDVFCAQSETPPYIMGDIYRFCKLCFGLVDFSARRFESIITINAGLRSLGSIDDLAQEYRRRISGREAAENQSWHDSLKDLLGGWRDVGEDDIEALADFLSCSWFTRVWTLQEFFLPCSLRFINEKGPWNTCLDRSVILSITNRLCAILSQVLLLSSEDHSRSSHVFRREQNKYTPGLTRCYFDLTRLDAFHFFKRSQDEDSPGHNIMAFRHVSMKLDPLANVLSKFARMPRTCMYQRDYIYGVAGLLDMEIPLADNDDEVWASFRKVVQERAPNLVVPESSALSSAENMQDVYKTFLGKDENTLIRYDVGGFN